MQASSISMAMAAGSNMEVENGYGFSLVPFLKPTSKTFTLKTLDLVNSDSIMKLFENFNVWISVRPLQESDIRVMIRDERDINIPHLRGISYLLSKKMTVGS
ncbi:hypothetical protein RHSIM_Rhsim06G0036300 [Rhododendron simsii]|uniref:Uncharacterized protein n=1 Tax=Rhododendron simsii TaxID=118357 RepID=A0A834LLW6_RHOSS|nr:hypothetical protein RHSIM_Rhsim06G0036300 [Rhododendron simsii]